MDVDVKNHMSSITEAEAAKVKQAFQKTAAPNQQEQQKADKPEVKTENAVKKEQPKGCVTVSNINPKWGSWAQQPKPFTPDEFEKMIEEYTTRNRRFGGR